MSNTGQGVPHRIPQWGGFATAPRMADGFLRQNLKQGTSLNNQSYQLSHQLSDLVN